MIRLNNTPNEGSTVKVNLGFRDSAGQYYIPAKIEYTLLALNNDKESWSVVDDIYEKSITPASNVVLTIPDIKTIEGTTLQRRIMIYWDAFVDGEYNTFTDEITFDIAPKPYVPNPPSPQPQPEIYVQVTDVSLQLGTIDSAPIMPVFVLKANLPVNIENAIANITSGDLIIPCYISKDNIGGTVTIRTDNALSYVTSYKLNLSGMVSTINDYVMKEPFELSFVTCREVTPPYIPVIEENKDVTVTENGVVIVEADENYDAMKQVTVNVELPIQRSKTIEITENGRHEIRPDAEFVAINHGIIDVMVPAGGKPEQSKELTVTENGHQTILPDTGYALSSVDLNVEVPVPAVETGKAVEVTSNGNMEIRPDSGYDAMDKVNLHIAVPGAKEEQEKSVVITENGTTSVLPDTNKALSKVDITVDVQPDTQTKSVTLIENGTTTITPDTDKLLSSIDIEVAVPIETGRTETYEHNGSYTVSPSTGNVAIDGVEVTVNVPLEANKQVSVDIEDYTDSIEITPTSGNDGMEKATVTLTNMTRMYVWKDPNATPNPHYMYTAYSDTSKCDGHAYQCGTTKNALLTYKNVEVNGDALYVSGYPNSLYHRDSDSDIQF